MATFAPHHIDIMPWTKAKASSTLTQVRTFDTSAFGLGFANFDAGGAANKFVAWDVAMAAGTWTLTVNFVEFTTRGIVTPSLDGVDLSTYDNYHATALYSTFNQWSGIVVATDGIKELKFRTDSKNASATDYDFACSIITLTRTGA